MVSKMIDPPLKFQLEILKFRFSLHMVSKMIDPQTPPGIIEILI